jgi:hypothetical protein
LGSDREGDQGVMDAVFTAVNSDKLEYRLTMTMTLERWKAIAAELQKWESSPLKSAISSMVSQAEQNFRPEGKSIYDK